MGKKNHWVESKIIGTLLALSAKHNKLINFETAFQYSLCPVPLCLTHPDGTRHKMMKSVLNVVSYTIRTEQDKPPPKQNAAFLVALWLWLEQFHLLQLSMPSWLRH